MSSNLMKRLEMMMPKHVTEPEPMDRIKIHPIRQSADTFAHLMEGELPQDERELQALLWVFGECLFGQMEEHVNEAMRIAGDAIAAKPFPVQYSPQSPHIGQFGKREN